MKTKRVIISVIAISVTALCFICFAACKHYSMHEFIEERWNIDIPNGTEEFETSGKGDPFGKDPSYVSIDYDTTPTEFIADFLPGRNKEIEKEFKDIIDMSNKTLIIPNEFYPHFDLEYQYKKMTQDNNAKRLYLFYFPSRNRLIMLEYMI